MNHMSSQKLSLSKETQGPGNVLDDDELAEFSSPLNSWLYRKQYIQFLQNEKLAKKHEVDLEGGEPGDSLSGIHSILLFTDPRFANLLHC